MSKPEKTKIQVPWGRNMKKERALTPLRFWSWVFGMAFAKASKEERLIAVSAISL
jgi:hypothetical protein